MEKKEGKYNHLHYSLFVDKDVLIESLQLELEAMRDISYLDATSGPIPHNESFERKVWVYKCLY